MWGYYVYQQIFVGGSAVAFQRKDSAESFGSIVIYPSLTTVHNVRVHVLHLVFLTFTVTFKKPFCMETF